tara:strand:- start:950 stop:1129 length:180 start_codon:yes stop_codon:yes gene_type:complete
VVNRFILFLGPGSSQKIKRLFAYCPVVFMVDLIVFKNWYENGFLSGPGSFFVIRQGIIL